MPFDISFRYGYPSQDAAEIFGGGQGRLWNMLKEVAELLEAIVSNKSLCRDEEYSFSEREEIRLRINRVLMSRLSQESSYYAFDEEIETQINQENGDNSVDVDMASTDSEEKSSSSGALHPEKVLDRKENDSSNFLIESYHQRTDASVIGSDFEAKAKIIVDSYPWNEAIPLLAAEILESGALRTRAKTFQFSDATKAFILATRFAGFRFLNPNHGDMIRHFFFNMIEKQLVKEAPWMAKFPAKPFSSMAANHPELFVKKQFTKPGSTREFTAYGLTSAGFDAYRNDMMKLGIRKGDLEALEAIIRQFVSAPVYEYPELDIEPDEQEPSS